MGSEKPSTWDAVFDDEVIKVTSRRAIKEQVKENLVGLAFSGGGIRSATFGLGVLEGLKPLGLLKKIDYLSTVSGGGYIGAWLSANCKRAAERKAAPGKAPADPADKAAYERASVDWLDEKASWRDSIAHLRRYSNYLSPQVGFFSADTWSMAAARRQLVVFAPKIGQAQIVFLDAECDPELKFEGLGSLIRMCEVDFGARITLDAGAIRPDPESNWSRLRCAVGQIDYGDGIPGGVLIYLKATMTGHEDSAVLQYKASHPDFPHESTGDQFYGEDQFESYRRLGREVAGSTFGPVNCNQDFVTVAGGLLKYFQPP